MAQFDPMEQEYHSTLRDLDNSDTITYIGKVVAERRHVQKCMRECVTDATHAYLHLDLTAIVCAYVVDADFRHMTGNRQGFSSDPSRSDFCAIRAFACDDGRRMRRVYNYERVLLVMLLRRGCVTMLCSEHYWYNCQFSIYDSACKAPVEYSGNEYNDDAASFAVNVVLTRLIPRDEPALIP